MKLEDLVKDYTDYVDVFLEDEKFYRDFIKVIKNSQSNFSLVEKRADKILQTDWIDIIEQCIPSLEVLIRNPRKFIETREEVLPIEISKNITAESIKHLCQHTNYISKIEGDKITPSKILNVFKEESLNTYENKFINTLINRLYIFIYKRYSALMDVSKQDNFSLLKMNQGIKINANEKLEISFEIKTITNSGSDLKNKSDMSDFDRVRKLEKIVSEYKGSDFVNTITKFGYIRPPIMRTNAILKDKNLRKCLDLWMFIESYQNVGYSINTIDKSEKPSNKYINKLNSITAISYAMFKHFTTKNASEDNVLRKVHSKKAIVPKFVKEIYDEFTTDYNISDVEFKKIMNTQMIGMKKAKSADEIRIRTAIDTAIKEEKKKAKLLLKQQQQ